MKYTKNDLDREARLTAREIRKETGERAKVVCWTIYLDGANISLSVTIDTPRGVTQKNIAI